jgi:hypothetical protein
MPNIEQSFGQIIRKVTAKASQDLAAAENTAGAFSVAPFHHAVETVCHPEVLTSW